MTGTKVIAATRETAWGWPMLTVETEVNGDLKSANERGPSMVGSLGLCRHKRCLFGLSYTGVGLTVVQKNFSLAVHYIYSFVPIAQQAGQAAVLDRLSLCMCFWMHQYFLGGTLHLALIGEEK
jgi:hypothetical protein